jgi:hypothetical protein
MATRKQSAEAQEPQQEPQAQDQPNTEAKSEGAPLKASKPTHYKIKVGKPHDSKTSSMTVIVNTEKYTIPYDTEVVVTRSVWDVLKNAQEPYAFVTVDPASGQKRAEKRLRPRFNIVDTPVV